MSLPFCGDVVRKHDPDRFLLSLYAPAETRPHLWALYAFNHEIAKTREIVTETQLGLIRLQWWRDALSGMDASHPVLSALAEAIRAHDLSRDALESLIYAREFDLEDRLPANLPGMMKYAEFTSMPLLELSLRVVSGVEDTESLRAVATAYALMGILRAVPFHASQQRCYLPEDLLAAEGLTAYDLYDGSGIKKIQPVVRAVCAEVRQLLNVPLKNKWVRRHAKLTSLYLDQVEKAGHDVFSPALGSPPFLKEMRLLLV